MNRATAGFVEMMEVTAPLPKEEDEQIQANFKSMYVPQIHTWVLCQKKSNKKRQLFAFLRAEHAKPQRCCSSMAIFKPADLVLRSNNCIIDLNATLNGRPRTRKLNRDRLASPGISGQGIFKEETGGIPLARSPSKPNHTLAQFLVTKLMRTGPAQAHLGLADEYLPLLQELSQWVDKKTNQFPVDTLRSHPTLCPDVARNANSRTDREDHLVRQTGPPLPINTMQMQARVRGGPWRTPGSAYNDQFPSHAAPGVASPFPPLEMNRPFCQFPNGDRIVPKERPLVASALRNQAAVDTQTGKKYKSIFQSETCL